MTRLRVEPLEDRITPVVVVSQNGAGILTVNFTQAGDAATIAATSAAGNSFLVIDNFNNQTPVNNVTGIVVADTVVGGGGAQGLGITDNGGGSAFNLGAGAFVVGGIESVQFFGNTTPVVANGGFTFNAFQSLTVTGGGVSHMTTTGTVLLRPTSPVAGVDVVGTALLPLEVAAATLDADTSFGAGGNQWIDVFGAGTTTQVNPMSLGGGRLRANADGLGGTLLVNGAVTGTNAPLVVVGPSNPNAGAFLGGGGSVQGLVIVQSGSTIGPGDTNTTATLTTGGLAFQAGASFGVKVAGAGAGQFDALNVVGGVNLTNGAIFVVPFGPTPALGSVLTVIANDGADAVVGTFAGLPQGATLVDGGGNQYTISYVGGTGNDVTLTLTFAAAATLIGPLLVTGPGSGTGQLFGPVAGGQYGAGSAVTLIPGFAGELHVVLADVTGDGVPDGIVGTGPGNSRVVVFDGANGPSPGVGNVLADFIAFPGYTGGVFVAAGDLNGDGIADLVVTPDAADAFSGPVSNQLPVRVYNGASLRGGTGTPVLLAAYDGLASLSGASGQNNPLVKLGGRPAVADVNGDGRNDVLIAAGSGGGPRITVWNGTGFAGANGGQPTTNPIANLFVFESGQRGGAFVAAGDVNGDGRAEVVVGGGPGGGPRVRIVSSAVLLGLANLEGVNLDEPTNLANGLVLNNFFAGSSSNRGGVRVAVKDVDGDGLADVVAGSGTGERAAVRVYRATQLATVSGSSTEPGGAQTFDPFGAVVAGGVWVG